MAGNDQVTEEIELREQPADPTHADAQLPTPDSPAGGQSQIDTSELDRQFIGWLRRRMRRALFKLWMKRIKNLLPSSRIGMIITAVLGVLTIYEFFVVIVPTLQYSEHQTRATEAQAAAAQWDNYQTWVLTVCPDEAARNISSPDCNEAMAHPIPPPEKPEYPQAASLSNNAARWLADRFVDAPKALLSDLYGSDTHCIDGSDSESSDSQLNCSSLILDDIFQKRSASDQVWETVHRFPLPSHSNTEMLKRWDFPGSTASWCFVIEAVEILVLAFCVWILNRHLHLVSSTRYLRYYFDMEKLGLLLASISFGLGIGLLWPLTRVTAKDTFLRTCMAYKTNSTGIPEGCSDLFHLASGLPLRTEIKLLSIWHGFYYSEIISYSMDNVWFLTVLVVIPIISSLYIGRRVMLHCAGWVSFCGGRGYVALLQDDTEAAVVQFATERDKSFGEKS